MRGSQRPDPKKRIKPEDLKALAIKKVFSKGKEARDALLAKIRTLDGAEKRYAIHSILNDADMSGGMSTGEHVPSYQSIFVESLNWQDFISIEDHPELYEEIEAALLCEADPDDSPEPPPQSPTMFMEDDDQETEHIVCPFCWYAIEESFRCNRPVLSRTLLPPPCRSAPMFISSAGTLQCSSCCKSIVLRIHDVHHSPSASSLQELKNSLGQSFDR